MAEQSDKPFTEKISDELELSGFASEIRAFRTFHQHRWSVNAGEVYQDLDEDKTREIDLIARLQLRGRSAVLEDADGTAWIRAGGRSDVELATERIVVHTTIVAEVKKRRSKPWVVLTSTFPYPTLPTDFDFDRLTVIGGSEVDRIPASVANEALSASELSMDTNCGWFGRAVHECQFEKNESKAESSSDRPQPSGWYQAAITVCKAAESRYHQALLSVFKSNSTVPAPPFQDPIELRHIRPLVILDGRLFTAAIDPSDQVNVQEVSYAPMRFSFASKGCSLGRYRVGIVTLEGLGSYLESHTRWMGDARRRLATHIPG